MDSSDPCYSSVRGDESRDDWMEQCGMGVLDVLTGDRESGGTVEGGLVVSGHPKLRRIKQSSPVRLQSIVHPSSPTRNACEVVDSAITEQNLCWEKFNLIAPLETISLPGDSQMDSDAQLPPCSRIAVTHPAPLLVDSNSTLSGGPTNRCLLSPCDNSNTTVNDSTSSNKALRERSLDVGYCSDSENDHSDVSRNASGVSDCSTTSVTVSDSESSGSGGGGLRPRSSGMAGYQKMERLPDRAIEQISPTGLANNSQEMVYDQIPAQKSDESTCEPVAPSARAGEARMFFASHHGSLGNPGEPACLSHQLAHSCSLSSSDIDPDLPYSPEGGCFFEQYPPSPLASTVTECSSELDFTCDDYLITRDYAVRLGYSEKLVKQVCLKLGKVRPSQDQLLEELLKIGVEASKCSPSPDVPFPEVVSSDAGNSTRIQSGNPSCGSRQDAAVENGAGRLRAIVIDGSNVAMAFGNKQVFSCLGIKNCVEWFSARGHTDIKVFVPQFRREESRHDAPITDQHILDELESMGILVWTPSRRIGSRRIVCHDDRFILKTAVEKDAIIVSNDEFRDLAKESPEFRKVIEERLLMFTMVDGRFMPPDDPLARWGPTLDQFLRVGPTGGSGSGSAKLCPYGKKCTYGAKCKFSHPGGHHQSVTEQVLKRAQKERRRIVASTPSIDAYMASQKKLQSTLHENGEKSKLCRAHSLTPALLNIPPGRAAVGHRTPSPNPPGTFGQVLGVNSGSGLTCDNNRKSFLAATAQQHQQQHLQQQHRLQQQQMRWMMMNQQRHQQRGLVRQPAVAGPMDGICLTVPPPHPPFAKGNSIGSALSDLERQCGAGDEHQAHAAMAHSASFDQLIKPSNLYGYNSESGIFDSSDNSNGGNELALEHKIVQPYQHPHRRGISAQLGQCHSLSADMNVAPVSYVNGSPAIRMRLGLKPHSTSFHKDSHRSMNNRMFVRPTNCSNANEQPSQSAPKGGNDGALNGVNDQDCAPVQGDQMRRSQISSAQQHQQHSHASLGRVMSNPEYWVNQNSATVTTFSDANGEGGNDATVYSKIALADGYSNSCFKPGNLRNANSSQLLSPVAEPNHALSSVINQRSAPDLLASGLEMLNGNSQLQQQLAERRPNWGNQETPAVEPIRQTEATFAAEAMEKALNEQLGLGGNLRTLNPVRQVDNPLFSNNIYPPARHLDQEPCQIDNDDRFVTSTGRLPYQHTPVTRYPSEPGSSDSSYRVVGPENSKFHHSHIRQQSTDQLSVNCGGDNGGGGINFVGLENRELGSPAIGVHLNGAPSAKLENVGAHSASEFAASSQQMPSSANSGHQQHTIVYAMSSDPGGKVSPHQHDQSSQHLQATSKFGLSASGGNFYIPSTDIWGTVENSVQPFGFNQKHN